jgi:hypothetical protein
VWWLVLHNERHHSAHGVSRENLLPVMFPIAKHHLDQGRIADELAMRQLDDVLG